MGREVSATVEPFGQESGMPQFIAAAFWCYAAVLPRAESGVGGAESTGAWVVEIGDPVDVTLVLVE